MNPAGTGKPGVGHLGQARALAAERVLHRPVAVGLAVAEEVDELLGRLCRRRLRDLRALRGLCLLRALRFLRHYAPTSPFRNNFRNIRQLKDQSLEPPQQPKPRIAQLRVVGHHHHIVEELRDRGPGLRGFRKRLRDSRCPIRTADSITGVQRDRLPRASAISAGSVSLPPRSGARRRRGSSRCCARA